MYEVSIPPPKAVWLGTAMQTLLVRLDLITETLMVYNHPAFLKYG